MKRTGRLADEQFQKNQADTERLLAFRASVEARQRATLRFGRAALAIILLGAVVLGVAALYLEFEDSVEV